MLRDAALGIGPQEGDAHGTVHLDDDTQVTVTTIHAESKKLKQQRGEESGNF
jgi:hypothetical protein